MSEGCLNHLQAVSGEISTDLKVHNRLVSFDPAEFPPSPFDLENDRSSELLEIVNRSLYALDDACRVICTGTPGGGAEGAC